MTLTDRAAEVLHALTGDLTRLAQHYTGEAHAAFADAHLGREALCLEFANNLTHLVRQHVGDDGWTEPEPAEATAEMAEVVFEVDVEPEGEGANRIPDHIWRPALITAVRRHLAGRGKRQHRHPIDQIPDVWEDIRRLHDDLPHGRRERDHSDVIAEAREIARDLMRRETAEAWAAKAVRS